MEASEKNCSEADEVLTKTENNSVTLQTHESQRDGAR